jgi:NAD(P)-dependent dehydrogenase (short-subunit alcohol dehydrogenase family)
MSADQKPVWLITGASRGLGKAIALKALAAGHQVGAAVRNLDDGKDLVDAYPETCRLFVAELAQNGAASGLAADVLKHFGTVDYLINNAGYGVWGMAEELEMENYYHQMQVNFFALVELTKSLIPVMRARGSGMIINVSSLAGLRGMQGLSAYNASKFAVEGFTEAIAQELTPFGVRVSVIEPGPYRTDWAGNSLVKTSGVQEPSKDSPYYELNQAIKIDNLILDLRETFPFLENQIQTLSAIVLQMKGKNEEASLIFNEQLSLIKPWNKIMGDAYNRLGRAQIALKYYKQALNDSDLNESSYINLIKKLKTTK